MAPSFMGTADLGLCQGAVLCSWGRPSLWTLASSPEELAFWLVILRFFPVLETCVHVCPLYMVVSQVTGSSEAQLWFCFDPVISRTLALPSRVMIAAVFYISKETSWRSCDLSLPPGTEESGFYKRCLCWDGRSLQYWR